MLRFKKGAFQMAKAAGVRIVPVSIGNLHRLLPANCPLPIAPIRYDYYHYYYCYCYCFSYNNNYY